MKISCTFSEVHCSAAEVWLQARKGRVPLRLSGEQSQEERMFSWSWAAGVLRVERQQVLSSEEGPSPGQPLTQWVWRVSGTTGPTGGA